VLAAAVTAAATGCGSESGPGPSPVPQPPPAANNVPVIESIAVQGTRARQPAGYAEVGESVEVTAQVRDDETAADRLQFNWTAPVGTFSGSGARVTWQAPSSAQTPASITLTLQVVERYGNNLEHRVSRTASVSLHDAAREVGDMARQFLLDFSDTTIKDASRIMRNFGTSATCPQPIEIQNERDDVIDHFTNFRMVRFEIGPAAVTVNFGGACPFRGKLGDACAVVPTFWDSIDLRTNSRGAVRGNDIVAAAYSRTDARWWLCASDFDGARVSGATLQFYLRR
jgi:hypothetical protein